MRLFLFILIFLQGSGLPPPGFSDGHSDELQIQECCQNGDSNAADVFKEKLKPLDGAFQKNQNEMKKAVEAARQGDKPATLTSRKFKNKIK
jgi:hypothetical protein